MSAHLDIQHALPVTEDTFWNEIFFNDEFNRRLYLEHLKFRGWEVLASSAQDDGTRTRKVRQEPDTDAPAAVQKLLGGGFYYIESGTFDPKAKRYRFKVEPSKLSEKMDIRGEFWVVPKGDKQIDRCCTIDIDVRIFGVGKIVEGFVEKSTRESYDRAAQFTRKYIAEKGL